VFSITSLIPRSFAAARELHRFGLALGADEGVEHRLDLPQGERVAVLLGAGARVGEADRAVEVARRVDLDDPEAGVLRVLGADPAVVRASARGRRLALERLVAGPLEALDLDVALCVPVHDGLERAVVGAAPAQDHLAFADDQLRGKHPSAARADGLGGGESGAIG
jgi:hypothetical protein